MAVDKRELRELFNHFDEDHNGRIDYDEFRRLLNVLGASGSNEEDHVGFELIDANSNGCISFKEFANWWDER